MLRTGSGRFPKWTGSRDNPALLGVGPVAASPLAGVRGVTPGPERLVVSPLVLCAGSATKSTWSVTFAPKLR